MNLDFAKLLGQGKGSVHGIDSSEGMIQSARERCEGLDNCTFEGMTRF